MGKGITKETIERIEAWASGLASECRKALSEMEGVSTSSLPAGGRTSKAVKRRMLNIERTVIKTQTQKHQ
jgi:hypothetical protein